MWHRLIGSANNWHNLSWLIIFLLYADDLVIFGKKLSSTLSLTFNSTYVTAWGGFGVGIVHKCMGESFQDYSWIQDFEADFP